MHVAADVTSHGSAGRPVMSRLLAIADLLGSVGVLTALGWRRRQFHMVNRCAQGAERRQWTSEVSDDFPMSRRGGAVGRSEDQHLKRDSADALMNTEVRHGFEVDSRRFHAPLEMVGQNRRLVGALAHRSSSIGCAVARTTQK